MINLFKSTRSVPEPAAIYTELRTAILKLDPLEVGMTPEVCKGEVWGMLMEMGLQHAVATLVVLAEGTTSMYFSNGGAILGAGTHAGVAKASQQCLAQAVIEIQKLHPAQSLALPDVDQVKFILLTFKGTFSLAAPIAVVERGKHPSAELWRRGQEIITQMRLMQEATRQNG